jgi:hypothetical protein
LPPKAGQPIRLTLPVPPGGEVSAGAVKVPLTAAEQKADGKPDVGVRVVVEHPARLPPSISIMASAAEKNGSLTTTFVILHMLEKGAKSPKSPKLTFDTSIFTSYAAGLEPPEPTVTVDIYLFNNTDGKPLLPPKGAPYQLNRGRKVALEIDDLITGGGPRGTAAFDAAVHVGWGVVVVGGTGDGVNLQGFVVNSHTGGFDLSVFGVEPEPLRPPALPPAAATEGAFDQLRDKASPEANALTAAVRGA